MFNTKKEAELIPWQGYKLPSWLFYYSPTKKDFVSPAARFNPIAALNHNPWQRSTTPSSLPKPKTLILTIAIFSQQHSTEQWLALIHWLQERGFTLYLCIQDDSGDVAFLPTKDLFEVGRQNTFYQEALRQLTVFDEKNDYEALAIQYNLSRDRLVILDKNHVADFFKSLSDPTTYIDQHNELLEIDFFIAYRPEYYYLIQNHSSAERKNLRLNPSPLLQLTKEEIKSANSLKQVIGLLKTFPDQQDNIIELALADKAATYLSTAADLSRLIQVAPDKIETLLEIALTNPYFVYDINYAEKPLFPKLNSSLKQQLIQGLLLHPKLITSEQLTNFVQGYTPEIDLESAENTNPSHPTLLTKEWLDSQSHLIKNINQYCRSLSDLDDIKKLLLKAIANNLAPERLLSIVAQHQPRLFYWLARQFEDNTLFTEKANFDEFIDASPERLEWVKQHHGVTITQVNRLTERRQQHVYVDNHQECTAAPKATLTNSLPLQHITYLYLTFATKLNFLTKAVEAGKLPQLVVIEMNQTKNNFFALNRFFAAVKKHCPHLRCVILPEEKGEYGFGLDCSIIFQKKELEKPKKTPAAIKTSKPLFIANNGLNKSINGNDSSPSTFQMITTGELLNAQTQPLPRLRTAVITLSKDFKQQDYYQALLTPLPLPKQIQQADIELYCFQPPAFCYCAFTINLIPGKIIRLPSVDAHEMLLGMQVPHDTLKKIRFFRGNDSFFYAKASNALTLRYFIKANSPQIQSSKLALLLKNEKDPLLKLVSDYLNTPESDQAPPMQKDITLWLRSLLNQRAGACRHRCWALWYAAKMKGLEKRVRLIYIDNNHMRIEIACQGQWYQVDLGGTEAVLEYAPAKLKPSITKTTKPLPLQNQPHKAASYSDFSLLQQGSTIFTQWLYKRNQFTPLHTLEDLHLHLFNSQTHSCLILNKTVQEQALILLDQAKRHDIPAFYLDKPVLFGNGQDRIILKDKQPVFSTEDDLDRFLSLLDLETPAIMIVNWDAFLPQQLVALNTLLDPEKTLYGKTIPPQVKILSLCAQEPTDASFLSRHPKKFSSKLSWPTLEKTQMVTRKEVIDVQGYPDWQTLLFGPIELVNNMPVWRSGPLATILSSWKGKEKSNKKSVTMIEIQHLPPEAEPAFNTMIKQAKAEGFFRYHGLRLEIPEALIIAQNNPPFSFEEFDRPGLCENSQAHQLPQACELINTTLFDYLLNNKRIHAGLYQSLPGLIESHQGQSLSLFITSPLSTNQWYCLLKEAQKWQVRLNLYTAPAIQLPKGLSTHPLEKPTKSTTVLPNRVYVTNQVMGIHVAMPQNTLCFAVEDCNYQDLIERIDYQYDRQHGFHAFEKKSSAIIQALDDGKDIVLYGQFDNALLDALAPQLLIKRAGQLTLVIEDKTVDEQSLDKPYPPMAWLPPERCQVRLEKPPVFTPTFKEEATLLVSNPIDLTHSQALAKQFMQERIASIMALLRSHALLQLTGPTAVGKSGLMEELKYRKKKSLQIYQELSQFENWAQDQSDKLKILFIDESNIDDMHLTLFDPMKENLNACLFYKGKFYHLSDKHRVVFASNPHYYGGGRNCQKLFEDGRITEFKLKDMAPAFIYERLLKPIYKNNADFGSQKAFKRLATTHLNRYFEEKKQNPLHQGVRALQENVLNAWLVQEPRLERVNRPHIRHQKGRFIPTPSTEKLQQSLENFITVHRQTPVGLGLQCFYLEGRPGMGKSELIRYQLAKMNYSYQNYLKIDASLPLVKKKILLLNAFLNGQLAWMDEGNSCMDDGLEKYLNSLLSGINPENGNRDGKPGFMLILTANSIGLEGRSPLSPALLARSIRQAMPQPTLEDLQVIIQKSLDFQLIIATNTSKLSHDLANAFQKNRHLTLREITPKLKKIAKKYAASEDLILTNMHINLEKMDQRTLDNFLRIHENLSFDPDSQVLKNFLIKAIKLERWEIIKHLLNNKHFLASINLKTLFNDLKKIESPIFLEELENVICFQAYHVIWMKAPITLGQHQQEEINFERAKALLRDYTKNDSIIQRFIHFHPNRHHIKTVNNALKTATNIHDLFQYLEKFLDNTPQGSLAKRIAFIKFMQYESDKGNALPQAASTISI